MEQPLFLDFKPHDDFSETLSTDTASLNAIHSADISPTNGLSVNSIDSEIGQGSKKIRKKRQAYQKIDDDIRLKLLEAVQRGETLKSAAKRYQVNYSSAKSIFHIIRKEGRILKKATTEKGFGFDFPGQPEGELQGGYPQQNYQAQYQQQGNFQNYGFQQAVQNLEQRQDNFYYNRPEKSGSSSPLNGLVNNFADLLRISNQAPQGNNEEYMRNKNPHMPINPSRFHPSTSPTHAMLKMQQQQQQQQQQTQASTFGQMSQLTQMNQQLNQLNQLNQINQQMNMQRNQFNPMAAQQMAQITLASMPNNVNMVSPSERMKQLENNFYMNYNNSPLSGNRGMIREGSESGSNRYLQQQNEFDSFSEMVSALQTKNHLTDSLTKSEAMAKLQHTPTVLQQQNSMEKIEEDATWNGNLGTAALDTFKTFVDAQMVLNNAFKKASLLNNLVQIQKAKADGSPSPKFMTFQGN